MDPANQLFTRQQIASLTGIDGSSLNYWSREGLLVPTEGGGGKGSHRRFDFVQVNIAAVLNELRRFGLNINALRSFAEQLQAAAQLGSGRDLHPGNYRYAAVLANSFELFDRDIPVMVSLPAVEPEPLGLSRQAQSDWLSAKRPAETEHEIVLHHLGSRWDYDDISAIVSFARKIGSGQYIKARIYSDLVYGVLSPGYTDTYAWLLALTAEGNWKIEFGDDGRFFDNLGTVSPEDFGAGIFIPVSGVFRKVWSLPSLERIKADRQVQWLSRDAQRLKEHLAAVGITAEVMPGDENTGHKIIAPDTPQEVVAAAIAKTRWAYA
jgi:DNA-binding transcriptional MerR regulator